MADHSPLLARDFKYFDAARKAADESTFKVHVGAVAVWHGRVIASAASQNKTHPMQKSFNKYRSFNQVGLCLPKVHAEMALLAKLKKLDVPVGDVKIYVYRPCKNREHGMARPCPACWNAMVDAGIRVVYYTTDYGYALEVVDKENNGIKKEGA